MKRLIASLFATAALLEGQAAFAQDADVPVFKPVAGQPVCQGSEGYAASFGGRRTFLLRPDWMTSIKARGASDPALSAAWKAVVVRADAALSGPTYSVVNKTRTPPSGDKHDYMSMGPYWWPDPAKPGGEPYVRRDGAVNPERDTNAFDTAAMEAFSGAVEALTLAYYYTDDVRYAQKAAQLLRVWFLDPATRMNPNTTYAQGVPGRTPGRAEGVLDTFRLMRVVEGIGLLAPAKVLTDAEQDGLERWFADYATWMVTSPNGKEERAAANNHAIWYDFQLSHYALFARLDDGARAVAAKFGQRRIATQIEPDGKLPHELARTRPLHYTVYALQAAGGTADLGRCVGLDVWAYRTADGRSLRAALDFIAPYVGREKEFPYRELNPSGTEGMFELFARAAWAYGDVGYGRAAAGLAARNPASDLHLQIAPYAP